MSVLLRWLDPILNPLACLPPEPPQPEIPTQADVLLSRLDALLRQKLKYALSGHQKGLLKGIGLDFADLREYRPGDDVRKMDWSVFARTLTPHVREYQEEKQLTLWLVVDLTPSMRLGQPQTKLALAVELFGLLALLAQKAGHKLGACLIETDRNHLLPPANGPSQAKQLTQRLLQILQSQSPSSPPHTPERPDPLTRAWADLRHVIARQSIVVILSDFITIPNDGITHTPAGEQSAQTGQALGEISRCAKLLFLMLSDPVERELPAGLGALHLQDPETNRCLTVDTCCPNSLNAYREQVRRFQAERLAQLKTLGSATLACTSQPALDSLLALSQPEYQVRKSGPIS